MPWEMSWEMWEMTWEKLWDMPWEMPCSRLGRCRIHLNHHSWNAPLPMHSIG